MTNEAGASEQKNPDNNHEDAKLPVAMAVMSAMSEGYVFQNMDGEIIDHNPAACRILRMTPDQLRGKTALDPDWIAIREDGSGFSLRHLPAMISMKTGKPCFGVVMGVKVKGDSPRWVQVNSDAVFDPETKQMIGAVATFSDITPQIVMKKSLQKESDTPEGKLMSARLELQNLLFDFTGPGNRMAAQVGFLKEYLVKIDAPEDVMKGFASLEAASENLTRLSAELYNEATADGAE